MALTNPKKLLLSLVITFIAAAIGSIFTMPSISTWYSTLQKPAFTPPNWAFGPVWTILYILMAISFYLVWLKRSKKNQLIGPITIYYIQLVLNVLWSVVFFGFRNMLGGMAVILVLWAAILVMIYKFYRVDKRAAYLLIPYILWVSIASLLNYFVWVLNI